MQLLRFNSEKEYLLAQECARKRKRVRPAHSQVEFARIKQWIESNRSSTWTTTPINVMCHGAYYGWEVDNMKAQFPHASVIGTDLDPHHADVVCHDFRIAVPEWIGRYDIIYSNSLDHADNPNTCLAVWLNQLSANGVMYIQWNVKDRTVRGGDCFGAELHEYIQVADSVGAATRHKVVDLLYCGGRCVVLLVISK